jgi:phosphate transport system substrate-binding protein
MALIGRALLLGTLLGGLALVPAGCKSSGTGANAVSSLSGGGSTFVYPMMKKWVSVYKEKKNVEVDYAPKGSGNGIQQMIARTYNFGCTDAPMNEKELAEARSKGGEVLHIPLVFGAVVIVYNVKELEGQPPLKLSGKVVADIFRGEITTWDHPDIKALNKDHKLPPKGIAVVHRAEPSGTNYTLTDYLSKVSDIWKKEIGVGKEVNWKTGTGKQGNQGVAGHVKNTDGAIGYVELEYAQKEKLPTAEIENKDGKFVAASAESVTAACKGAEANIPPDLCLNLNNQPGEKAYPIIATVWAVFYQNQKADVGKALVDFISWCVHDGQSFVSALPYAPLSEGLVAKIDEKLKTVKFE